MKDKIVFLGLTIIVSVFIACMGFVLQASISMKVVQVEMRTTSKEINVLRERIQIMENSVRSLLFDKTSDIVEMIIEHGKTNKSK